MSKETSIVVIVTMLFCVALYLIPRWRHWLLTILLRHTEHREPNLYIGGCERPYMLRWWIIPKNPLFNMYFHHVLRDDDDRALHDHPWYYCSIILKGGYWEVLPAGPVGTMETRRVWRGPGSIRFASPWSRHRLELDRTVEAETGFDDILDLDTVRPRVIPAWTLFITGPVMRRSWGFHCEHGWIGSRKFAKADDPGEIGLGCDQPADKPWRASHGR